VSESRAKANEERLIQALTYLHEIVGEEGRIRLVLTADARDLDGLTIGPAVARATAVNDSGCMTELEFRQLALDERVQVVVVSRKESILGTPN